MTRDQDKQNKGFTEANKELSEELEEETLDFLANELNYGEVQKQ